MVNIWKYSCGPSSLSFAQLLKACFFCKLIIAETWFAYATEMNEWMIAFSSNSEEWLDTMGKITMFLCVLASIVQQYWRDS